MGDRNNPIKFGPEWLRNMSRERSAGRSTNNSLNAGGGGVAGPSQGPAPAPSTSSTATNNDRNKLPTPRVLLAGLRYGREEMLALYDGNAEAPSELKNIENLYQHRGKQPVALNNTFDDDLRDNLRSAPPIGGMASSDRFGIGRSAGRGGLTSEGRGRGGRGSYTHRQITSGRGGSWISSNPRMPGFSGGPSEEGASARPWTANNANNRNSGDQTEWATKMFRNKRPGTNTNWRQPTREEGEEWRSSTDTGRNRQLEKWGNNEWGNNWGERPVGDRPPSWNNRRPWVGGDSQNEENLPEWVAENADCGGSFDSSGAFHGYSNDDSNIPKPQETTHPLTRSHTHGSFPRPKLVEEGSDEWWASEKAKKLSPKRFDASDIKFKKQTSVNAGEGTSQNSSSKTNSLSEESAPPSSPDKLEPEQTTPELPEATLTNEMFSNKNFKARFSESFDNLMKQNIEDANVEKGDFQSVLIAANNSLRQKHQYLVPADTEEAQQKIMEGYFVMSSSKFNELEALGAEDLVDDIFGMSMEEKELMRAAKSRNLSSLESLSSGLSALNPNVITQKPNNQINIQNHDNINMEGTTTSAIHSELPPSNVLPFNLSSAGMLPSPRMPVGLQSPRMPVGLPNPGMMPGSRNQAPMPIENAGVTNSALNASLGLPIGPNIGMPMQGIPPPMPNVGNTGPMASGMMGPSPGSMPPFSSNNGMANNLPNSSLFLGPNPNNQMHPPANDHPGQPNMFPMHGQHNQSQPTFPSNNMYMNNGPLLAEQWFYEDPDRNIQGPFSSKDMYNWYRAGFFTPSLMVRRACETMMRPLGTYGPVVPFAQPMDMLPSFPLTGGFESRPQGHENVINSQSSGLDVDNLWGQPSTSNDMVWMQHPVRSETRVNHLPIFFWDQQPSAIASNALLPEEIAKEMKTEDEILAQLRASQNIPQPNFPFINDKSTTNTTIKADDCFAAAINATPNLEELHKLIQKETLAGNQAAAEADHLEAQQKQEKLRSDSSTENVQKPASAKPAEKPKAKENDKSAKNKENNNTKNKNKKNKEDKKDDVEIKTKEDEVINAEKRSQEPSPSKNKKEEKTNKKELEREKKEWIKEGFTIVKGAEKTTKDNKKKVEEARAADEAERKRKEEEKLAADEEKKRKQAESAKKQQEQQQRQAAESVAKKAPWSVAAQSVQASREPTLAEIQRLEREKKLEQMKEQQQMMQIIAQQQAAALAREQEMQAGLGWAKKKGNNNSTPGQSLAEIQAEARKQAASAAAASAALEEAQAPPPQNNVPWGNTLNGGLTYGFWDTQPSQPQSKEKVPEPPKPTEPKAKKKPAVAAAAAAVTPAKKEPSPAAEFETWCTTVLASWSSKIDVPTFVGFLKDIESPYEVKDYVKCYLGETKDSGDFARQFLERRSKLLRVGMVTPSDDLCSPAMAVTPRGAVSDLELKSKGKKTKKNRMLKVDARILGFSVTAAEDRINVGDIDTA